MHYYRVNKPLKICKRNSVIVMAEIISLYRYNKESVTLSPFVMRCDLDGVASPGIFSYRITISDSKNR